MPTITIIHGEKQVVVEVPAGSLLGDAVALSGLPLEQPCAGRGTCGKCKVLVEAGAAEPDAIELEYLTPGELAVGNRLACRARLRSNSKVLLAPIVIYSNKIFKLSSRYKTSQVPLGLAIDLGSTTVAAFLTTLDDGLVCAGGASLNQQTVYGADVISRLSAALQSQENAARLRRLALASINQAVDSLSLSIRVRERIQRVTVVGNVAMHHLLLGLPIKSLATRPFQPFSSEAILDAGSKLGGIFPENARVDLPPLIGGFVGSDALACLACFGFENAPAPMAAIDLGTNGEVLVTDGKRILAASTAAGPAFEGVFISCGTRAVDGAITRAHLEAGELVFDTIGDASPVGLTGSGLLSLVHTLRQAGIIDPGGKISSNPPWMKDRIETDEHGARRLLLTPDGHLGLSQWDIRELQKAKGAIRAAMEILMSRLGLGAPDLQRVILTGSFGGQIEVDAALELGLIPPVGADRVEMIPNGAGLGAALFLSDNGFQAGLRLAGLAEQVDLDRDEHFTSRYIGAMTLASEVRRVYPKPQPF